MDCKQKTAIATFIADPQNYAEYSARVKEFIEGFGVGKAPQG